MCSCPYSYHNQHRQSVTHLRSFPSLSQESVISPLLQKPTLDKDQLSNYRPISNLSLISKIIERVVKSRLLIIRCLQWSSQSQTVRLLQASLHWNSSAVYPWSSHQCHRITEVVLSLPLDLSAAFDTIDHNILIARLSSWFGIHGSVLNWTEFYLTSRSFRVKCDKDFSSKHVSSCGVPQDSVLGPLLFVMYSIPPHSALLSPHFL